MTMLPADQSAPEVPPEDTLPPLDDDLGVNGEPLLIEEAPNDDAPVAPSAEGTAPDAALAAPESSATAPKDGALESSADAPPAPATPDVAPPAERTYTQTEVSNMQRTLREREEVANKARDEANAKVEEAQLLARASEFERERTAHHESLGETPERAAALAKDDRTNALNEVRAAQGANETANAQRQAAAIAVGHDLNLPAEEIRNLVQFNSVEEMQQYGQGVLKRTSADTAMKAENARLVKELADLKRAAVPAGGPSSIVDSATGETPALTDQQIIDRAGDPDVDMSDAEMRELDSAMSRLGYLDA